MATGVGAGALTTGAEGVGVSVSKKDGMLITGLRSGLTEGLLGSLLYAIVTLGGGADLIKGRAVEELEMTEISGVSLLELRCETSVVVHFSLAEETLT